MAVLSPKNKDEFLEIISKQDNKLYVADFFAVWCGPCKMTAPQFEEIAEEYGDKITCVKVDVDKEEELANEYDITVMPTFVLIKNATTLGKVEGTNVDKLRQLITDCLSEAQ